MTCIRSVQADRGGGVCRELIVSKLLYGGDVVTRRHRRRERFAWIMTIRKFLEIGTKPRSAADGHETGRRREGPVRVSSRAWAVWPREEDAKRSAVPRRCVCVCGWAGTMTILRLGGRYAAVVGWIAVGWKGFASKRGFDKNFCRASRSHSRRRRRVVGFLVAPFGRRRRTYNNKLLPRAKGRRGAVTQS